MPIGPWLCIVLTDAMLWSLRPSAQVLDASLFIHVLLFLLAACPNARRSRINGYKHFKSCVQLYWYNMESYTLYALSTLVNPTKEIKPTFWMKQNPTKGLLQKNAKKCIMFKVILQSLRNLYYGWRTCQWACPKIFSIILQLVCEILCGI